MWGLGLGLVCNTILPEKSYLHVLIQIIYTKGMQTKQENPSILMKRHSHQLEIKIKYPTGSTQNMVDEIFVRFVHRKWTIRDLFFVATGNGIGSGDYQSEQFSDIRSYTRLNAPCMSLKNLLNSEKNRCWIFLESFLKIPSVYPRHKEQ